MSAGQSIVSALADLIKMKSDGSLDDKEFASAKTIALEELFKDVQAREEGGGEFADGSKRVRRRSAKDWMTRIQQDSTATSKDADAGQTGTRTQKMFGVWGAATTEEYLGGKTPEDKASGVAATLKDFFADGSSVQMTATDADGIGFKGEGEKSSFAFGKWFKDDGTWQKLWEFYFRNVEWNLDIANGSTVTTGNVMSIDYGWTRVQSLKTKKFYECYIKSDCGYTDDMSKITFQKWTFECGGANFVKLLTDDGFTECGCPPQFTGEGTLNARSNGKAYAE